MGDALMSYLPRGNVQTIGKMWILLEGIHSTQVGQRFNEWQCCVRQCERTGTGYGTRNIRDAVVHHVIDQVACIERRPAISDIGVSSGRLPSSAVTVS